MKDRDSLLKLMGKKMRRMGWFARGIVILTWLAHSLVRSVCMSSILNDSLAWLHKAHTCAGYVCRSTIIVMA